MKAINTSIIRRLNFKTKAIWIVFVLFTAAITGIAISEKEIIYFAIALSPFIVYLCIHKPFIFPFGLYVFLLPFENFLSVTGGSQGATLTKFLGALTILVLCLKGSFENKLKRPDPASIWLVLFVIYGFLTVWWAIEPHLVMGSIFTAVSLLLLYLVVASYKLQKDEFETIKWCILFGGFVAAAFTIYNYQLGLLDFGQEITQRATLDIGGRKANANTVGFSLIFPIAIGIHMVLEKRRKIIRVMLGAALFVTVFALIITGARGSMLGVAGVVIINFLSLKNRITFGTVLIVIAIIIIPFIPDLFFERWAKATSSGGAGRMDIWYAGLKALEKHWLFGAGLNNFPAAYDEFALYPSRFMGYYRAAHNTYLGNFVELGIVGFSFMILAIWKHYKAIQSRIKPHNFDEIMLTAVLFGVLIAAFFGDYASRKVFWLVLMMICMYKNVSVKNSVYL
ncbi:MAG: O-antigen ligase family protein [Candidatus Scalindua sp.]|nr:O-antigen ligase family protein [Candidatus Scalindua sp.]